MKHPPTYETIDDVNIIIENLSESIGRLKYIGKYSEDVQQARFEQFTRSLTETIDSLTTIRESLKQRIAIDLEIRTISYTIYPQ